MPLNTEGFKKITAIREQLREELKKVGIDLFSELFKSFFEQYPEEYLIRVKGFVPYFNDGDACVFSIYDPELFYKEEWNVGEEEDEDPIYREGRYSWDLIEGSQKKKDLEELYRILEDNEDAVKQAFGEHFVLFITKEGIRVEEYADHD